MEKIEKELRKTIREFRLFVTRAKGHRIRLDVWQLFILEMAVGSILAWFFCIFFVLKIIDLIRR
jgi:hypothetical protein